MRIGIVGGGISGLATAHFLSRLNGTGGTAPEVFLLERSGRLGGVVHTIREGGYLMERGPDGFSGESASMRKLLDDIDLESELIGISSQSRKVSVLGQGRLRMLPEGMAFLAPVRPSAFWTTAPLSRRGKLRAMMEPLIPRQSGDSGLRDFFQRRLGKEFTDRIAGPLLSGIYVREWEHLSVRSNLPFLYFAQQRYGSLYRGMRRSSSGGSGGSALHSCRSGISALVESLEASLEGVRIFRDTGPVSLLDRGHGFRLLGRDLELDVDAAVLACPADAAAEILSESNSEAASLLRQIPYRSSILMYLAYGQDQIGRPLEGSGFVAASETGGCISACTLASQKFEGRAPDGMVLLRCSIRNPEWFEESQHEAVSRCVHQELQQVFEISGSPRFVRVFRTKKALPQLKVGHHERMERIDAALDRRPGIFLTGAYCDGAGIPSCVSSAESTAEKVVRFLGNKKGKDGVRIPGSHGNRAFADIDFEESPFVAIWETTRACDLACRHCRAEAISDPLPGELTTEEGFSLLEELAEMGTPICVLSGGDPAKRSDLCELVRHGAELGMRMATIPAATPLLTEGLLASLKEAGLHQLAFSLDGSTAERHDAFRQTPGAFERTLRAARTARRIGLPLQINTVFSSFNRSDFRAIAELVTELKVVFWEVFFLVPMGRGRELRQLNAEDFEKLFGELADLAAGVDFIVKVTEAPHYRRFLMQAHESWNDRKSAHPHASRKSPAASSMGDLPGHMRRDFGPGGSVGLAPKGVNSGKGHLFVNYRGDVFPSGFLPLECGNVRKDSVTDVYRHHPAFRSLRDPELLKGKCGVCEFRSICGGSRARAYAMTGDILASEPFCAYRPGRA